MAVLWVRLHGSLSSHCAEEGVKGDDGISIMFSQERVRMEEILARLHIPDEAVAFVAVNGIKSARDTWVTDGDKVSIFPLVAGG
jgi:molybdopterin converting factor small subunit